MNVKFRPAQRLLLASDYSQVFDAPDFKTGQREFLLLARRNHHPSHRLGLAIAKKHVPTAVKRNLIKRLARECFRTTEAIDPSLDIVLLTRPGARDADRAALKTALKEQFQKLSKRAKSA